MTDAVSEVQGTRRGPPRVDGELTLQRGGGRPSTIPLERDLVLGARVDADVVLRGSGVAPTHLVVAPDPRGALLIVLEVGRAPVLVNGEPARRVRRLMHGDRITIDDAVLTFRSSRHVAADDLFGSSPARALPYAPGADLGRTYLAVRNLSARVGWASSEAELLEVGLDLSLEVADGVLAALLAVDGGAMTYLMSRSRGGRAAPVLRDMVEAALSRPTPQVGLTADGSPGVYVALSGARPRVLCVHRAPGAEPFNAHVVTSVAVLAAQLGGALDQLALVKELRAREWFSSRRQRWSEAALSAVSDGLLVVSADGAVEVINTAGRDRLRQLVGRDLPDRAVLPADCALNAVIQRAGGLGANVREELTVGSCVLEVTVTACESIAATVVAIRDVTSERARDAALRDAEVTLQREILNAGERERRRVGQDLHDGVCQLLAAATFLGERVRARLTERALEEAADVAEVKGVVEDAMNQARSLARGLCPVVLEDEDGLLLALRELAARTERLFQVQFDVLQPTPVHVDEEVAIHLYRITQEATANSLKHGRATRLLVELGGAAGEVRLVIDDDGAGLPDPLPSLGRGMGLKVMQHRARALGARLAFERSPLGGARVECIVPTRREAAP